MSGDVTFTYTKSGQQVSQVLRWADRINSREGLGLWHVGSWAWKVYSTRTQYNALSADYRRAAIDAGLPMGDPSFQAGRVQRGTAAATDGFVLITQWMEGVQFLHTAAAFKTALTRDNFPHGRTTTDYQRYGFVPRWKEISHSDLECEEERWRLTRWA